MDKKVAWVTGASGGIGSAIVRRLAADGYTVALGCHHSVEETERLAESLREQGAEVMVCPCDVADPAAVTACEQAIAGQLGEVALLVNNAGIALQKLFQDTTDEDWRRLFSVHVDGAFFCTRAVLPAMLRRHSGCVLTISSMWGQVGASCEVAYSAAKSALIGMTRALAKEVAPSGIRINAIAPGVIDTAMMADFSEEDKQALAEETPLGRLGTPEDVADAAAFLASDHASFITGQILGVNGGLVI